jgi:hypothetical protein
MDLMDLVAMIRYLTQYLIRYLKLLGRH